VTGSVDHVYPGDPLTEPELAALQLLAAGRTAPQIATDLYLSIHGAKARLARIYRKLDARTGAQAVHLAHEAGLLGSRPPRRHGDHAGYRQHERAGDGFCQECIVAELAYQADRRARRRSSTTVRSAA
jgi:DNA-binding CsgD family transcriptional regulator